MKKSTVLLDLQDAICDKLIDKDLRDGLSAATRTGNYLWVVGDEQVSIQRLEKTGKNTYGKSVSFQLSDYIDLPDKDDEADVEGMDYDGRYLWIVGSHSYKRSNIKANSANPEKEIRKLTKVSIDPNRVLLARIPCLPNEEGEYVLHKSCPDPKDPESTLTAAKLKHSKKWSQLTKKLKDDIHLKDYLKLPGKDNGFDIEGVAAYKNKLFLGLRGPVLRGWAILLEVQIKEDEDGILKLAKIGQYDEKYLKFFLDLHGMGIRELATDGEDLLILAGPTMDLDGNMAVYRWKGALQEHPDYLIAQNEIEELCEIPFKNGTHGEDKAEGMVMLEDHSLMIIYDSPSKDRTKGEHGVMADLFHLDS